MFLFIGGGEGRGGGNHWSGGESSPILPPEKKEQFLRFEGKRTGPTISKQVLLSA